MSTINSYSIRTVLAAAIGLLSAGPLPAQGAGDICRAISDVSVGQWVEYRFVAGPDEEPMTMHSAIVGTEDVDGAEHFWHESKMQGLSGSMIIQMLVPGYPFDLDDVQRTIMKMGDQPAMEMSDRMLGATRTRGMNDPVKDIADQCEQLTEVGRESVTVPAGTFETLHLRQETDDFVMDMWITRDTPFGLVKATLPDQGEVVLVDYGTGAESSITETPQRMPGMP